MAGKINSLQNRNIISNDFTVWILQFGGSVDGTGVDVKVVVGVVEVVVVTGLASGGLKWQSSDVSMIVASSIAINPSVPSPLNALNTSCEIKM